MKLSKMYFNMVELVLALAVVSIAIVALMGMLPVALKASKNSVADNSLSTVVEIMKTYMNIRYANSTNLSDFSSNNFPTPPSGNRELYYQQNILAPQNVIADLTSEFFPAGGAMQLYYSSTPSNSGIFRVELYSGDLNSPQTRTVDFDAVVHIWKEQYNGTMYFPLNVLHAAPPSGAAADEISEVQSYVNNVLNGTGSLPPSILRGNEGNDLTANPPETDQIAITLVMRISYPAAASFENQEHRIYKFDYFRK